jgi:hypothetical protein
MVLEELRALSAPAGGHGGHQWTEWTQRKTLLFAFIGGSFRDPIGAAPRAG